MPNDSSRVFFGLVEISFETFLECISYDVSHEQAIKHDSHPFGHMMKQVQMD